MDPLQLGHARASIENLRIRLHDIVTLLHTSASADNGTDRNAGNPLTIAIHAIEAVSEDLQTVCNEQLSDGSFEDAKARQAKSEVDSGEFDSES